MKLINGGPNDLEFQKFKDRLEIDVYQWTLRNPDGKAIAQSATLNMSRREVVRDVIDIFGDQIWNGSIVIKERSYLNLVVNQGLLAKANRLLY